MNLSQRYPPAVYATLDQILALSGDGLERRLQNVVRPYESFRLPKGSGTRLIEAPDPLLKSVQRALLDGLLYRLPVSPDCHGFVPGRSIVTHARRHHGQRAAVSYDIADAFPSVSRRRAHLTLQRRVGPFLKHQGPRVDGATRDGVIELLADLVTHDDHLPQGAPTSGAMLNLVLAPLDRWLRRRLRRTGIPGLLYTRYADDLTVSAAEELPAEAEKILRAGIHRAGFRFNPRKVRRCDRQRGQSLVICGLQVDGDELRLPRQSLRRYRAALHGAFCLTELDDDTRARIYGIAGLVHLVYGQWPAQLARPWQFLAARHRLAAIEPRTVRVESGY